MRNLKSAADVDVERFVDEIGAALTVPGERDEKRRQLGAKFLDPAVVVGAGRRHRQTLFRPSDLSQNVVVFTPQTRRRLRQTRRLGRQLVEERAGRLRLD